ncbi:hypothetical protein [Streptococcus sp. DD12]|uniref:hypothetical protein n=1 Tax=Streptococcus sp. DD12 TaxID=1777880 RepID=UPI0007998EBC|nr:hypothetical protein [Streptococcus sp. DD12]KXT76908.1 putative membrane protein [Streptococcus sp. DD12]
MKRKQHKHQWLSKGYMPYLVLAAFSLVFTGLNYVVANTSSQIYDYPFHLARIVGLANSISHGDWLPNLNDMYNRGIGYGVPMFYGNWQFYLPAFVFLWTKVATLAFSSYVFLLTLSSSFSAYWSVKKITNSTNRALLFSLVYPTLIPYYGFGMTAVVPFIPLLFYAIYKVLYLDKKNPVLLGVVIALLVQTHIISTIVLAIASGLFVLLNLKKWTLQKMISFALSGVISILLTLGFIFQYLEQSRSQTFFVNWKLRDFPFPTVTVMSSSNLWEIIQAYTFPLALVFLLALILLFRQLNQLSKQLVLVSTILLLASSSLLPWDILRHTSLAVFQYTHRLTYFLPIFVMMALFISGKKLVVLVLASIQVIYFALVFPLSFLPSASNYKDSFGLVASNIEVMRGMNAKAVQVFTNPYDNEVTFDTSGDEYFNLDTNHENARNGQFNQFQYDGQTVAVTNIHKTYNNLEFDVTLPKGVTQAEIVLPKMWYKGYAVTYSNGASGSQVSQKSQPLTAEEEKAYQEVEKPKVTSKVLYDGRGVIDVTSSGHVKVFYQKTATQITGFVLEILAWLGLITYSVLFTFKNRSKKSTAKTVASTEA